MSDFLKVLNERTSAEHVDSATGLESTERFKALALWIRALEGSRWGGGDYQFGWNRKRSVAARVTKVPQCDIFSSARSRVGGPINPIAAITISIAAAMNTNTPATPNFSRMAAMKNELNIADNRLHE